MTDEPVGPVSGQGPEPTSAGEVARTDEELDRRTKEIEFTKGSDVVGFRRLFARTILVVMFLQIAAANTAFYLYGFAYDWQIPVAAINGWLAATVVQVVSVVLVITRYLFPPGGSDQ